MEDAATAEIARCQVWQWIQHPVPLADGGTVTDELVRSILDEEVAKLAGECPASERERVTPGGIRLCAEALQEDLPAFFTVGAYADHLVSAR